MDLEARFHSWWAALARARDNNPLFTTTNLYVGDHWAVSRELPGLAKALGWAARLWTLSAGYGLVPADAGLAPYSATFQPRQADSVSRLLGSQQNAEQRFWWKLLCSRIGPDSTAPRSFADLVRRSPATVILLVASPQYLLSIQEDLYASMANFRDHGGLVIVSSAVRGLHPDLETVRVESNARLQSLVQGSLLSLHARVARWLIQTSAQHLFSVPKIRNQVMSSTRALPSPKKYDRKPATDEQIRKFLRKQISSVAPVSHTRLLREWRGAGHACEQGRFRELFQEVQETIQ